MVKLKLSDMICVTAMKTSDLSQQHKPNPRKRHAQRKWPKEPNTMLLAKITTDQALFNLCQDTLSCFVLYIQHTQTSEQ